MRVGSEDCDGTLLIPELLSVAWVTERTPGLWLEGRLAANAGRAGVEVR